MEEKGHSARSSFPACEKMAGGVEEHFYRAWHQGNHLQSYPRHTQQLGLDKKRAFALMTTLNIYAVIWLATMTTTRRREEPIAASPTARRGVGRAFSTLNPSVAPSRRFLNRRPVLALTQWASPLAAQRQQLGRGRYPFFSFYLAIHLALLIVHVQTQVVIMIHDHNIGALGNRVHAATRNGRPASTLTDFRLAGFTEYLVPGPRSPPQFRRNADNHATRVHIPCMVVNISQVRMCCCWIMWCVAEINAGRHA
jgi:hypothetical protein